MNIWIAIISILLILAGTAGSILPFIPGLPVSLAGLWLAAIVSRFEVVSVAWAVIFTVLALLVEILNIAAPALGARGYKSSSWGVLGAMLGAILGVVFLGPLGIILGPFIGGFAGEYLKVANTAHALRSARGAVIGILIGSTLKIMLGLSMLVYFIVALIKH